MNRNEFSWLDPEKPLNGFQWNSGIEKVTQGILFWPDVFLYDCPKEGKLAILLMDTQGLFDNGSTTQDNARIFSLSVLLTSTLIFNTKQLIREDQLQYLRVGIIFFAGDCHV
jgi:atlastin